jgi:phage baseplate assembly protein W
MPDDPHLLTDLAIRVRQHAFRPVYDVVATETRRRGAATPGTLEDLGTIGGRANLGQALVMRLLTPLGELAGLGHPEYGSRLPDLVGRGNTATTRDLLKLAILDAVVRDPRVAEVVEVQVDPAVAMRDMVEVLVVVVSIGSTTPVQVGPFTLELGT